VEYKEIQAAQGVKIAGKDLEKAIAGEVIIIKNVKSDALKFESFKSRVIYECALILCNGNVANSLAHNHIIIWHVQV
jgi:translation initiation factor IF-2